MVVEAQGQDTDFIFEKVIQVARVQPFQQGDRYIFLMSLYSREAVHNLPFVGKAPMGANVPRFAVVIWAQFKPFGLPART